MTEKRAWRLCSGMHLSPVLVAPIIALVAIPAVAEPARQSVEAVQALLAEVVNIAVTTYKVTPAPASSMAGQSSVAPVKTRASGFIVDASGLIVTNRHAVADAAEIMVVLHDTTRLRANLVATARQSDIALLKVKAARPLPQVKFGDSEKLRPGDGVSLFGNPLGLGSTITSGIVSALDRNTQDSGAGSFFQIDAALNHGNSGGPGFNSDGEVVGVATALISAGSADGSVGLGLAIPSNDAKAAVRSLLEIGRDPTGWIGARVERLTADLAAAVGLPTTDGSIVLDVSEDGPAFSSGLTVGDVILKVDGESTNTPRTLNRTIAHSPIGAALILTLWRLGSSYAIPIIVGEAPAGSAEVHGHVAASPKSPRVEDDYFGLVVGPLTPDVLRKFARTAPSSGVAVIGVVSDSIAEDRGIAAGSIILNVNRRPVRSAFDLRQSIDVARAEKQPYVMLLVEDEQGRHWQSLPMTKQAR